LFAPGEVTLSPQIARDLRSCQAQLSQANDEFSRLLASIEQTYRFGAVCQLLNPNFPCAVASNAIPWLSEGILIHINDFVIAQQAEREIIKARHVAAENERCGHQTPQRHMRVLFIWRQWRWRGSPFPVAEVSQEQVIRVIPAAWPGKFVQALLRVNVKS